MHYIKGKLFFLILCQACLHLIYPHRHTHQYTAQLHLLAWRTSQGLCCHSYNISNGSAYFFSMYDLFVPQFQHWTTGINSAATKQTFVRRGTSMFLWICIFVLQSKIAGENSLYRLILSPRMPQTIISVLTEMLFCFPCQTWEKQVQHIICWQLFVDPCEAHNTLTLLYFLARGQDAQHTVCSSVSRYGLLEQANGSPLLLAGGGFLRAACVWNLSVWILISRQWAHFLSGSHWAGNTVFSLCSIFFPSQLCFWINSLSWLKFIITHFNIFVMFLTSLTPK